MTRNGWPRLAQCAFVCHAVVGCTYSLSEPCDSTSKLCDGRCVPVDDPGYGCSLDGCQPCAQPDASCAAGSCAAPSCGEGLGDCDPTVPGCETSLFDNPKNCGSCGYDCLESSCQGLVCKAIALASEQNRAYDVVVDNDYVYWTDDTIVDASAVPVKTRSVGRALKDAPTDVGAEDCAVTNNGFARGITLSDREIYWVDALSGEVLHVAKTCGAPQPRYQMPAPSGYDPGPQLEDIVFADGNLYFTDARHGSPLGNVWTLPAEGSAPAIAILSKPATGSPWWLAIDETHVYWTNYVAGQAKRAPRSGGAAECVGSSPGVVTETWGIAVDEGSVYFRFANDEAGGLRVADKAAAACDGVDVVPGGAPEVRARDLAMDGDDLFWVRGPDFGSEIVTACKDGSGLRVLQVSDAHGLAVDDTHVYWTVWSDAGQGGVYRVARPPSACQK